MRDLPPQPPNADGLSLLAAHCRSLDPRVPSARERLEVAIGPELARMLVFALVPHAERCDRRAA